jgi:hypothetical protein
MMGKKNNFASFRLYLAHVHNFLLSSVLFFHTLLFYQPIAIVLPQPSFLSALHIMALPHSHSSIFLNCWHFQKTRQQTFTILPS